jgi:hypothetical protein
MVVVRIRSLSTLTTPRVSDLPARAIGGVELEVRNR